MSFLEMLDVVSEQLAFSGKRPIAFDHDCREGICGACAMMIDGVPRGAQKATAACQLYMRTFRDGVTILVEPWRARAFPLVQDLMVDRSAFDRIIQAGGYVDVHAGGAPDANDVPIAKATADHAMDAAACIGCGACVAGLPERLGLALRRRQDHPSRPAAAGPARTRPPRGARGRVDRPRRLRQLQLVCRMPGDIREGDQHRQHRPDGPRLRPRDAQRERHRRHRGATRAPSDGGVGNEPPHKPSADAESLLGGADVVEKTTWVVGEGTDPNVRKPPGRPPAVGHTRFNPLLWTIVLIFLSSSPRSSSSAWCVKRGRYVCWRTDECRPDADSALNGWEFLTKEQS